MATIDGDNGDNILPGTPENDLIRGFGGNDVLSGLGGRDRLEGGADDDILNGGDEDDTLVGGAGHDELYGEAGDDSLIGGDDWDIIDGGEGVDDAVRYDLEGGPGRVIVNISGLHYLDDFSNSMYAPETALDSFGVIDEVKRVEHVLTGEGADVILGSLADNFLAGWARNDLIFGGNGNDELWGEGGDDWLFGDGGNDGLDGGAGDDVLNPSAQASGFDVATGGEGRDLLVLQFQNLVSPLTGSFELAGTSYSGQIGNVTGTRSVIYSGIERFDIGGTKFDDRIGGGLDDDRLVGFGGNDQLFGAGGADILEGEDGADQLYGSVGNDILRGGIGNDGLFGEDGDDLLDGGADDDDLDGGSGSDQLAAGFQAAGHDRVSGGAGTDLLVVDFTAVAAEITGFYSIDPNGGYSGQLSDFSGQRTITYSSIERYSITGTVQGNSIAGLDGNDELFGLVGNDRLFGGAGDDRLDPGARTGDMDEAHGGAGTDLLVVDFAGVVITAIAVDPSGGYSGWFGGAHSEKKISYSSIERFSITGTAQGNGLEGYDGDDELFGLGGDDRLIGGGGNDRLDPGAQSTGTDEVRGGAGTDTLVLDFGNLNDPLAGFYAGDPAGGLSGQIGDGEGRRTVTYSSIEQFEIRGSLGADQIGGADGDDMLNGFWGDDQLFGGAGNDSLSGSFGSDRIHGGLGRDTLSGGGDGFGEDVFHFAAAAKSAVGSADRILDFFQGQDRIDLSAINSNPATAGNDAFVLSADGQFHSVAGEVRWYIQNGIVFVEGDLNGDNQADFQIELIMPHGAFAMTAADFVL